MSLRFFRASFVNKGSQGDIKVNELQVKRQEIQKKFDDALVAAVEFELVGSVANAGGELLGLSVRFSDVDCLLTLKALLPAGQMVAFVGGATLADCFRRAVNEAYQDKLRWKEDQWGKN